MGASCSRRLMSYILHSRNSDDSGACDTQFSLQTSFRRLGILGVPLSFKARRLSIDKGEIEGKGATVPNLLDACIAHFAKSLQHVDAATLDRIPNELIQKIFDDLVEQQRLDSSTVSLFGGRCIDHAYLASQPGVTDDWLYSLCSEDLRVLQISHCRELTDNSLARLSRAPNLTSLALDCCFNITKDGLEVLAGLPRLRSLSLEACDCVGESGLAFLRGMADLRELSLDMCSGLL